MQLLLTILSDDPIVRATQVSLLVAGFLAVYLVCYATRDILLRTRSFLYQAFCILLVAALPVFGFFLYLLVRPARTVRQRETDEVLRRILAFTENAEVVRDEEESEEAEEQEEAPDGDETPGEERDTEEQPPAV
ncbi:MAG: PLD nuclease N-terminal domain-containing protein [Candidatus Peribacteraceae bacterium]|nr:PLD nuclease N-terminal domain-containing protein [Candidatus Peribacteraceae bacterium]